MKITSLVLLGDYSDDQEGYDQAFQNGAVYVVNIDEQSYAALYNVQAAIAATCRCSGIDVHVGLAQEGQYIPLSVVEDTSINPQLDYDNLREAFDIGVVNLLRTADMIDIARKTVASSLLKLDSLLMTGEEKDMVTNCMGALKRSAKTRDLKS